MKKQFFRLAITLLVIGLGLGTRAAQATTFTWTGVANQDWNRAENWRPAGVPTSTDTVVVGSGFDVRSSKPVAVAGASFGTETKVNFNSSAVINGPLSMNGVSWVSSGDLNVSGLFSMTNSRLDGSGNLTLKGAGDASNSSISNGKNFTIYSRFAATDCTFTGSGLFRIATSASLTFQSNSTAVAPPGNIIDRDFSNAGTVLWSSGNLVVNETFSNLKGATIEIQSNGGLSGKAVNSFFTNTGTLKRTGLRGRSALDIPYTSTGTMQVETGILEFDQGFQQTAGECSLNGGSIVTRTGLKVSGGVLNGTGLITGDVVLDGGSFKPGHSPGSIVINGNYTQTANGSLDLELGGITPGTGYDQLIVNGTANLAGTLNILPYGGFAPVEGSNFELLDYYSLLGNFTTINNGYPSYISFTTTVTPIYIIATAHIASDQTIPTANTTAPLANGIYAALASATGTAADNVAVTSVTVQLHRYATAATPAGYWAGGSNWTAAYSAANERPATGTTNWSVLLPSLTYGSYVFRPIARDAVGNVSNSKTVAFLKTNGNSAFTASTVVATASTNNVRISFNGPLDSVFANTPSRYAITLTGSGTKVSVQSALYDAVSNSVTLTVPAGALVKGTAVTVAWSNLFDSSGRLLKAASSPLTVQ